MSSSELAPLEATVAKLTARAPDKLYTTDTARGQQRLEAELERQLARHADDDYDDSADSYLDDHVFEANGDEIVVTDAYPRNAGMASGIYQALNALRLPSGATVYYTSGEWEPNRIRAVSAHAIDDEAAAAFGEIIALPTYFHAGDDLLEIDRHLSACTPGSYLFDELVDHEAEWMEQEKLDEGDERRAELQRAIDESREEGDADADQLDRAQQALDAVADYPIPGPDRAAKLAHKFHPWTKPAREMFLDPDDPVNRQHIIAAYLAGR